MNKNQIDTEMQKVAASAHEVWLSNDFLEDIARIRKMPVNPDDPELTSLIDDCIINEHVAENITPEIRVIRFGSANELSIYFSTESEVITDGKEKVLWKKYVFTSATVGHHWVDRKSKYLAAAGRLLVRLIGTGTLLSKGRSVIDKIKEYIEENIS